MVCTVYNPIVLQIYQRECICYDIQLNLPDIPYYYLYPKVK